MRVTLRAARGRPELRRLLNLSQGGMLIAGNDLTVGRLTRFELRGSNFQYAGVAAVTHASAGRIGLRFLSWQGPVQARLRSLIASRIRTPSVAAVRDRRRDQAIVRRVALLIGASADVHPPHP